MLNYVSAALETVDGKKLLYDHVYSIMKGIAIGDFSSHKVELTKNSLFNLLDTTLSQLFLLD